MNVERRKNPNSNRESNIDGNKIELFESEFGDVMNQMFYEKQKLKEYFENEVKGLIVYTLFSYKGVEFFTKLDDKDEFILRKDINFFRQSYRMELENFLNFSYKLFDILLTYFNQLKRVLSDSEKLSLKKVDEQLGKVKDLRKTLDRTHKYLTIWIKESENYYADRLETFTFESEETGQMNIPVDSISSKFSFINPVRIQTSFPHNLNKLSEIHKFIIDVWQSHFEFFFSEDGVELDTNISGISEVERRFNILKNQVK